MLIVMSCWSLLVGIVVAQKENVGFYANHPAYAHDLPRADHYRGPVPFGLPLGGRSLHGRGPPFGLASYLARGIPIAALLASMRHEYEQLAYVRMNRYRGHSMPAPNYPIQYGMDQGWESAPEDTLWFEEDEWEDYSKLPPMMDIMLDAEKQHYQQQHGGDRPGMDYYGYDMVGSGSNHMPSGRIFFGGQVPQVGDLRGGGTEPVLSYDSFLWDRKRRRRSSK